MKNIYLPNLESNLVIFNISFTLALKNLTIISDFFILGN